MFLTKRGDLCSGVERMYLDLVDGWMQARFRCEKLLQLKRGRQRMTDVIDPERRASDVPHMLDAKVAHTSAPYLSVVNGIFDGPPGFQSLGLATIRAMQQEQVNVSKAALLYGLFYGPSRSIVGCIGC